MEDEFMPTKSAIGFRPKETKKEIKKPSTNIQVQFLNVFRPPSRHKTPPKAIGLDLPERPQTPPETQKELEDLSGLSKTQHLNGISNLNEDEIKNNQEHSAESPLGSSGILSGKWLDKETAECPPENSNKPDQHITINTNVANTHSKLVISPSASNELIFTHERNSSSQRKGLNIIEKNPGFAVPVRAWGLNPSTQCEDNQTHKETREEPPKTKPVIIAKPSTVCTNQILGGHVKDSHYQYVYPPYMNTIVHGSVNKPTCDMIREIRTANPAQPNDRHVNIVNSKGAYAPSPPKPNNHAIQLSMKWYFINQILIE
jgi:hypothetical protein